MILPFNHHVREGEKKMTIKSIVKVGSKGSYGRGFWVGSPDYGLIVTAAHCLPYYPTRRDDVLCYSDLTYADLVARPDGKGTCWAECLFLDPVADLAVLTEPCNQFLSEESDKFSDFASRSEFLEIGSLADGETSARIMFNNSESIPCIVETNSRLLTRGFTIKKTDGKIKSGMSGSPILTDDGKVVGVLCNDDTGPILSRCLPPWILNLAKTARERWEEPEGSLEEWAKNLSRSASPPTDATNR